MEWANLNWLTYNAATASERVEARKLVDIERQRLYELDRQTGSKLLLGFTIEYMKGFEMSEVRNDIPPPDADAPAPAKRRGRPKGSTKPSTQAAQLQAALEFVSCAQSDVLPFGTFVNLNNKTATVFNGQIAAGYPIVEELNLVPHIDNLKAALSRCGKSLVITETENQRLSIKGDKLRALVPCYVEAMPPFAPDEKVMTGDFDALKEAFKVCGTLASEAGERVVEASLLLEPNTCTGTNGAAMLQYWHGIPTPPGTVVSKAFAAAIAKQSLKIVGLGAEWNAEAGFAKTLTVWFENGAWIKTQCYTDRWPAVDHLLATAGEKVETPAELFEAIAAVLPFSEGKDDSRRVYFFQDFVQSHADANIGAQYKLEGLPGGKIFSGKLVGQIAPWCKRIDLLSNEDRAFFTGGEAANPVRGVIMCMSKG